MMKAVVIKADFILIKINEFLNLKYYNYHLYISTCLITVKFFQKIKVIWI